MNRHQALLAKEAEIAAWAIETGIAKPGDTVVVDIRVQKATNARACITIDGRTSLQRTRAIDDPVTEADWDRIFALPLRAREKRIFTALHEAGVWGVSFADVRITPERIDAILRGYGLMLRTKMVHHDDLFTKTRFALGKVELRPPKPRQNADP